MDVTGNTGVPRSWRGWEGARKPARLPLEGRGSSQNGVWPGSGTGMRDSGGVVGERPRSGYLWAGGVAWEHRPPRSPKCEGPGRRQGVRVMGTGATRPIQLGREWRLLGRSVRIAFLLIGLLNIQSYRNVVCYLSTGRSHYYRVVVLDQTDAASAASDQSSR